MAGSAGKLRSTSLLPCGGSRYRRARGTTLFEMADRRASEDPMPGSRMAVLCQMSQSGVGLGLWPERLELVQLETAKRRLDRREP